MSCRYEALWEAMVPAFLDCAGVFVAEGGRHQMGLETDGFMEADDIQRGVWDSVYGSRLAAGSWKGLRSHIWILRTIVLPQAYVSRDGETPRPYRAGSCASTKRRD